MKRIENHCVSCPPGMPCMGNACPNRNVPCFYCDICGEETDIYHFDGEELCIECIKKRLDKVE